jgi:hypothetical protein
MKARRQSTRIHTETSEKKAQDEKEEKDKEGLIKRKLLLHLLNINPSQRTQSEIQSLSGLLKVIDSNVSQV